MGLIEELTLLANNYIYWILLRYNTIDYQEKQKYELTSAIYELNSNSKRYISELKSLLNKYGNDITSEVGEYSDGGLYIHFHFSMNDESISEINEVFGENRLDANREIYKYLRDIATQLRSKGLNVISSGSDIIIKYNPQFKK